MAYPTLVQLERSQLNDASEIAALAFAEDPVFCSLTPSDRSARLQALICFLSMALKFCDTYGHVYTTPSLQGIAAWLPPHQPTPSTRHLLSKIIQYRLYEWPSKFGWNNLQRLGSFFAETDKCHEEDMQDQPHLYLFLLFVNPDSQGQGIGSILLQHVLDQADRDSLPCYLLTFTEQAVRFYQKNGFEVLRNRVCYEDFPPYWTLRRNPSTEQSGELTTASQLGGSPA